VVNTIDQNKKNSFQLISFLLDTVTNLHKSGETNYLENENENNDLQLLYPIFTLNE